MIIALVNPPKTVFDVEETAPPLGLLKLASIACQSGATACVEDYNLLWHIDEELRTSFYDKAVSRLLSLEADVYGFTSMAVDSHVALELGRRIKLERPDARIWVGGVHFSSIADQLTEHFPWVDRVFRGEGEAAFADALSSGFGLKGRNRSGAGTITPLYDAIPLEAYFHLNPRCMVDLEAARGCRFNCTYCYSPSFFATVTNFAVDTVIEELARVRNLGVRHVWFVEDNFLNFPERALRLCAAIAEAQLGMTWSCYATFPQLTQEAISSMARAGCTEVFTGIDAVGLTAQRTFRKAFLKSNQRMRNTVAALNAAGIKPTCAFLLCPPSHPGGADFEETVWAAVEAQSSGAEVLLNPLTLYANTYARTSFNGDWAADDLMGRLMMDVPDFVCQNRFAITHPELFPFHSRYVPADEWRSFLTAAHCLLTLIWTYPKTLSNLQRGTGIGAIEIAEKVLARFGPWDSVSKEHLREVEQDVGFMFLDELTMRTGAARTLHRERPTSSSVI